MPFEGAIGAATAELTVARKLYRDGRLESTGRVKAAGFYTIPGYFGYRKSERYSKLLISKACARPGCPRSDPGYGVDGAPDRRAERIISAC
jgi:hypothetical protein